MKTKSILPNSSPEILKPIVGKTGTFLVVWNEMLDMHVLLFTELNRGNQYVLAGHHNGHSCHSLAQAMVQGNAVAASRQFKYILDCGGINCSESLMKLFVQI